MVKTWVTQQERSGNGALTSLCTYGGYRFPLNPLLTLQKQRTITSTHQYSKGGDANAEGMAPKLLSNLQEQLATIRDAKGMAGLLPTIEPTYGPAEFGLPKDAGGFSELCWTSEGLRAEDDRFRGKSA